MSWKVSDTLDQRMRFVLAHESGSYQMSELCRQFGISRQSGYKWLSRYRCGGAPSLQDRSRAPKCSPQRMDSLLEALLLESRRKHPTWGPRKILAWLQRRRPDLSQALPAASTVGDLFQRNGLIQPKPRRARCSYPVAGPLRVDAPNQVWSADYKGEFRLASGPYCYPFTLTDAYSRYLLMCRAQAATSMLGVKDALTDAFRLFGMPQAIRTDNGSPFVGHGQSGLSQLGVWWIKLGIAHQRIAPGRPDQNGRHERMHRTLKAEATRPPEGCLEDQQLRFDQFGQEYNLERPHEGLGQQTPASRYLRSAREFPEKIAAPEYPAHFERRKVNANGFFKFRGVIRFIGHPLANEPVGLVEIDDDIWSVCFYDSELGRIDPSTGTFIIKVSTMSPV